MQILNTNKDSQKIEYVVQVSSEEWTKKINEITKALAKQVKVEGFRVGHVPYDIAVKHISKGDVLTRALDKIIEPTRQELEKSADFEKGEDNLIEVPSVDVVKIDDKELELKFIYDLYPVVTLGDYKKISLPKNEHETVTDAEVDAEINKYLRYQKKVVDKTEGKLEKGDIAVFDFEGFKDGVAFAGGTAKNFELEIGSNQFVPGFEDQMVGMTIGETRELDITFPENYAAADLAGAKTVFKVTLNGMKSQSLPTLDEAFVEKQNIPNVKTIDEFKAYVKKQIQAQYDLNYTELVNKDLVEDIVQLTQVSHLPVQMIEAEKRRIKAVLENQLRQQGLTLDKYIELVSGSQENFNEVLDKDSQTALKYALAIEKIAEDNKIEVTEEDINEYFEKVAKVYNMDATMLRAQLGNNVEALKDQLLNDKVIKALIEWNKANPVKEVSHDHHDHDHSHEGHNH